MADAGEMSLGSIVKVCLKEAREAAERGSAAARSGLDLIGQREK